MTFEQRSMTADEVLGIMAQVVAEYGDTFVYAKVSTPGSSYSVCLNWDNDCPSCLIGHVMHRWGMPEDILANFPSQGVSNLMHRFALKHGPMGIENGAMRAMAEAQANQDDGTPWGLCLEKARRVVEDWRAEVVLEGTVES